MMDKSVACLVDIKLITIQGNTIINNIPQTQKTLALICPNCNEIISTLNTMSYKDACQISNEYQDRLPCFCSKCGQKLNYNREVVSNQ